MEVAQSSKDLAPLLGQRRGLPLHVLLPGFVPSSWEYERGCVQLPAAISLGTWAARLRRKPWNYTDSAVTNAWIKRILRLTRC